MAVQNWDRAFAAMIKHEGGYVDHPRDPGGATNLGVTIGTLSGWLGRPATKAEVRALTVEKVKPIYRKNYWDAVRGDAMPSGLDYALFDYGVNSGPRRAIEHLQGILGVTADGRIGPVTIGAIGKHPPAYLINQLCDRRLRFLQGLGTWQPFGRGWTNRVAGVRSLAIEMAGSPVRPDAPAPRPSPPDEPGNFSQTGIIAAIFAMAALAAAFFFGR